MMRSIKVVGVNVRVCDLCKGINGYTLNFVGEGIVTLSLVFNNGYSIIYKCNY